MLFVGFSIGGAADAHRIGNKSKLCAFPPPVAVCDGLNCTAMLLLPTPTVASVAHILVAFIAFTTVLLRWVLLHRDPRADPLQGNSTGVVKGSPTQRLDPVTMFSVWRGWGAVVPARAHR